MFGIKINGKFLELGKRNFIVKLQSPLFWGDNADVIPASVLISSSAKLTKINKQILGNINILSSNLSFPKNILCELWANGSLLYMGKLSVLEATQDEIKFSVTLNSIADLKDINLTKIQYDEYVGNPIALAMQSVIDPDSVNFICPTVLNPMQYKDSIQEFIANQTFYDKSVYQNLYVNNQMDTSNGATLVPYPKVNSIIKSMFNNINFTLNNPFEQKQELRNMLLYFANPILARVNNLLGFTTTLYNSVKLNRHVPNIPSSDFLKMYLRDFNLGIFSNTFERKAYIKTAEEILTEEVRTDWTDKILKDYTIKEINNYPNYFKNNKPTAYPSDLETIKQIIGESQSVFGIVYSNMNEGTYLFEQKNVNPKQVHFVKNEQIEENGNNRWQFRERIRIEKDIDNNVNSINAKKEYNVNFSFLPSAKTFFLGSEKIAPMAKQNFDAENQSANKLALFLYRDNFIASSEATELAEASSIPYNAPRHTINNVQAEYSTVFSEPEYGIYAKFWSKWIPFLQNKKQHNFRLNLNIRDLREFSLDQKVFIFNQIYLIKSLEISFDENGIVPNSAKGEFILC